MLVNTLYPADDGDGVLWERIHRKSVNDEYAAREFPLLRPCEVAADALMTDGHGSLAWEIMQRRGLNGQRTADERQLYLRRVFGVFYFFAAHNRGLARSIYLDLAAKKLGLLPREVKGLLQDAVLWGIPALMGVTEYELRQVT